MPGIGPLLFVARGARHWLTSGVRFEKVLPVDKAPTKSDVTRSEVVIRPIKINAPKPPFTRPVEDEKAERELARPTHGDRALKRVHDLPQSPQPTRLIGRLFTCSLSARMILLHIIVPFSARRAAEL